MQRATEGSAVSRPPARHQKPPRDSSARRSTSERRSQPDRANPPERRDASDRPGAHARHRKAAPARLQHKPVKIAAAVAGSTLLVSAAAPVVAHWHRPPEHHTALDQERSSDITGISASAGAAGTQQDTGAAENALSQWAQVPVARLNAGRVAAAKHAAAEAKRAVPKHAATQPSTSTQPQATESSAYRNPLRSVGDLVLERVDQGADFGGAGPVYALGDGVVTSAEGDSSGWPGGGWITYRLTDGPDEGLTVYLAEDVTPAVQAGQTVTSSTVIGNMFNGGDGIETGWATSDGSTAESQMPEAGGIGGGGPFPTMVGLSFDALLQSLGVPAAPNAGEAGNGLLPSGYPAA
jgi:hypothetical protein